MPALNLNSHFFFKARVPAFLGDHINNRLSLTQISPLKIKYETIFDGYW